MKSKSTMSSSKLVRKAFKMLSSKLRIVLKKIKKKKRKVSGLLRNKKSLGHFVAPYGTNHTHASAVNIDIASSDAEIMKRLKPTRLDGEPRMRADSRNSKCSPLRSA